MTYEESMRLLTQRPRFRPQPGLAVMHSLLSFLGDPHTKLPYIHVAGTNGKGTACTLLASVLKEAGYKTGLYTSPHVVDFCERFRINGEPMPAAALEEAALAVDEAARKTEAQLGMPVTEFEAVTAAGFWWFSRQACDIAVLEVGMGGRYDATNVIPAPLAAVIMSVSLDHTAVLGDTPEKIAWEKAGIVKPSGDVVLYRQSDAVRGVVEAVCREENARLWDAPEEEIAVEETTFAGTCIRRGGVTLHLPFVGAHQVKNAAAVLKTVDILRQKGIEISDDALQRGFQGAHIAARMEYFPGEPPVLLDGGHNPGCAQALADVLRHRFTGRPVAAVMGILGDKDSRTVLEHLVPCFDALFTVTPSSPRALSAEELAAQAEEVGCTVCRAEADLAKALRAAKAACGPQGLVVVCGSFVLAGDVRPLLV